MRRKRKRRLKCAKETTDEGKSMAGKRRMRWLVFVCAGLMLALPGVGGCAEEKSAEAVVYVENQWNFVDGSMDVSGGIPEDAEGALLDIKTRGVLRVATEPYYPPQEFIDPALSGQDQYVGADMTLARLIAQRMNVALEIVPMDFSEVLTAVEEGRCDLAFSALSFTPARAYRVEMSKGYFYQDTLAGNGMVIRMEDKDAIFRVEDLKGRDIVAQSGSIQESITAENVLSYRQFRRVENVQDVYEMVQDGRADAGAVELETAIQYIENNPDCGLTLARGIHFTMEEEHKGDRVAGRKGEIQLMYFVNGVIDEVLTSGQYMEWYVENENYAKELGL